jgi:hypothetical protein
VHFVSEAWVSLLWGASGSRRRGLHYFLIISEKNGNIRENGINIMIISPILRGIL